MFQKNLAAAAFSVLFGAAMVVGCDETISEKKTTEVKPDGTVIEQKSEVKETADGTVVEEKSTEIDRPGTVNDQETSTKTEVKND